MIDRREFLIGAAGVAGGAAVGVGLPSLTKQDVDAPNEPISLVLALDSKIHIWLHETPMLEDIIIFDADRRIGVVSWDPVPDKNKLVTKPLKPGKYRVISRREGIDIHVVQKISAEVRR